MRGLGQGTRSFNNLPKAHNAASLRPIPRAAKNDAIRSSGEVRSKDQMPFTFNRKPIGVRALERGKYRQRSPARTPIGLRLNVPYSDLPETPVEP